MVMTRHQFLAELHKVLEPRLYLEVGVQFGGSLDLAHAAEWAVGIDPNPLTAGKGNQEVYAMTADEFFEHPRYPVDPARIDFGYIDGSHLFEDVLRDFINVEQYCKPGSVIALDDVLPYNQAIAERVQPPGDWTGDVWKIHDILQVNRPDLELLLVDTAATGTLVVLNPDPSNTKLQDAYESLVKIYSYSDVVPDHVLNRENTWTPEAALDHLRERAGS